MKKLLTAVAICAATTTAFAADTMKATDPTLSAPSHAMPHKTTGIDATEVGKDPKPGKLDSTANAVGLATESQGTFRTTQSYDIEGVLKKQVANSGVTIERKGLPAASLDVRDHTAVMLDGKKCELSKLADGQMVRAKFQIEGEEVVALRVEASSKDLKPMKK